MDNLFMICIDDQREVLNAMVADLASFEEFVELEACQSGEEVWQLMEEIDDAGDLVCLIVSDHVMPGMTGVELLTQVHSDARFTATRKLLLTGLATHEDTIEAINAANLDMYISKPWNKDDLIKKVSILLTKYVLAKGLDHESLMPILDPPTLFEGLKSQSA